MTECRLPLLPEKSFPWHVRLIFWIQRKRFGSVLTPTYLWGRIPSLLFSFVGFFLAFERKRSYLSPELRSLIMVRVSQINWCRFCVDLNGSLFLERTEVKEKIETIENWEGSPLFSPLEKLALAYAEAMTITDKKVSAELFNSLKTHLGESGIIELTALIAYQNLSSKFNAALDVAPQGFCKLPPS